MQRELPAADAENGGHASHRAAPGVDENVSCRQGVHALKIMSGLLNLPGAHRVHCMTMLACNVWHITTTRSLTLNMFY